MIVTLTPNPSLDFLFTAERLVWDDANRVPMPRRRPGGQGVNLVRAARALDPAAGAVAIAPLGGPVGDELMAILEVEGTPVRRVPIRGETRVFVGAREGETGRSMLLNPRGPDADAAVADALLTAVEAALTEPGPGAEAGATPSLRWVACCGSLLPGLAADLYGRVGEVAARHGARFVPDGDGEALALAAGAADLLVPNDMEAARLVGRPVRTPVEAVEAGRTLVARGCPRVAITLGDRGAVLVTAAGAWRAWPALPDALAREAAEGSAVGAGDAFLAALLLTLGDAATGERVEDGAEKGALTEAVAAGTAVLLGRGAALVRTGDVERVRPHVRLERLGREAETPG